MNIKRILYTKANQVLLDLIIFLGSFFFAYLFRFEGRIEPPYMKQLVFLIVGVAFARLISFGLFSIYSIVWRYISPADALEIVKACLPMTILLALIRVLPFNKISLLSVPAGIIALEFFLVLSGTLGIRILRRLMSELTEREYFESKGKIRKRRRVILIGAGAAGNMVVKEIKQRPDLSYEIVGFIDDATKKYQNVIQGYRVLGTTDQIPDIVKKFGVDEAIITIANASSKDIRRIVELCERIELRVKIIPGLYEMLDEKTKISRIREVNIDDLLGRSLVKFETNQPEITKCFQEKTILITGAGGSIGSELCRQLAVMFPRQMILLDKDENSVYEIDRELNDEPRTFRITPVVANIKNYARMKAIFEKTRPDVVFHAAAHKHVPLMEANVSEAILNNVLGTRNVAALADQYGAERFIFISTDKAINPTNVMGATKKIGEIIVQELASRSTTNYVCVRFGNVLGSRGSVVPLFFKQIARGGPITVTHPEVRRYFMSISEAVQLIIQAGTLGRKGEIFVLDMGEPIRILDLAKDLIRLSGIREDDIQIKFIGLRPGEKLYEEILVDEERTKATQFQKIFIAPPAEIENKNFSKILTQLLEAANANEESKIIGLLSEIGIGYRPVIDSYSRL